MDTNAQDTNAVIASATLGYSERAYALLLEMGEAAKKTQSALEKAKARHQGVYGLAILAAIACETVPVWNKTMMLLYHNIQHNVGGIGAKMSGVKNKKGDKYIVPTSVRNARNVLTAAFEHGVSLVKMEKTDDGKLVPVLDEDGNPVVRGFNDIEKENRAVKLAAQMKEQETLTGFPKLKLECLEALAECAKRVKAIDVNNHTYVEETAVKNLMSYVSAALTAENVKPLQQPAKEENAGESLASQEEEKETAEPEVTEAKQGEGEPEQKKGKKSRKRA